MKPTYRIRRTNPLDRRDDHVVVISAASDHEALLGVRALTDGAGIDWALRIASVHIGGDEK